MALNSAAAANSSCTQAVATMLKSDPKVATAVSLQGVLPLPMPAAKVKLQGSQLRRTKSRKPMRGSSSAARPGISASLGQVVDVPGVPEELPKEIAITQAVSKVGEEIATTSGEILDAVDSVIEDAGAAAMRVRKNAGKANSRTSRRRALVMCLALGMVRPCASNVASNLQQSNDLRRTASATIRRTSSSSFKVPNTLVSQVSLATTLKQTNLLGEQEDLQKLTSLQ